jgi:hypothetical protein
MTVGSALRELGRFLDEFERAGAVRSVGLVDSADADARGRVTADVELTVAARATGRADATEPVEGGDTADPTDGDAAPLSLAAPTVEDDGTLRLAFESTDALVPATDGIEIEPATVTGDDDGTLTVVLSVSVPTDADAATGADEADGAIETDEPDTTARDDPEADDESRARTEDGVARDDTRGSPTERPSATGTCPRSGTPTSSRRCTTPAGRSPRWQRRSGWTSRARRSDGT